MYHDLSRWLPWLEELAENDVVIVDDFIDASLYADLRQLCQARRAEFEEAGIGAREQHSIQKKIRGDWTHWLDRARDRELEVFWQLVDETLAVMNRYCFLSLSGYEFHLAHYPVGSHYNKHLDQFANRNNRMISMVVYLNEGWQEGDGGELEIFPKHGSPQLIPPLARRGVLFKSAELPHQVHVAKKDRYSLTGWLLYQSTTLRRVLV